ncbi:MAG: hypothetical protein ACI88H_001200 [Cocleimonas sp.]|jgi:hypothetical protein
MSKLILGLTLFLSFNLLAKDSVPYSIKAIKSVGSGFVELTGGGFININDKTLPYNEVKYVSVENFDSLTKVSGVEVGCIISYSTSSYSENISVIGQTCADALKEISRAKSH